MNKHVMARDMLPCPFAASGAETLSKGIAMPSITSREDFEALVRKTSALVD